MLNKNIFDVIVVGGGPAGVHAAYPLVESGLKVAMIDGGITSEYDLENEFEGNFEQIRRRNKEQHKLFLGHDLSKVIIPDKNKSHADLIVGGNRSYISDGTSEFLPVKNNEIHISQSLAKGGLSETWGAACDTLDSEELEKIGIPSKDMHKHYQEVIDRIGVSGISKLYDVQSPLKIDNHARKIMHRYMENKTWRNNVFDLKQPLMAVLSEKKDGREPVKYEDLEYWMNRGKSIYRARFTLENLEKNKNFKYFSGNIVTKVNRIGKINRITANSIYGKKSVEFKAKYVILAAGSINTTRILLKSFDKYDNEVPFMTKSHFLIPCLHVSSIGKRGDIERHSFCQLSFGDKRKRDNLGRSFSQIYSYKSLLLYKLLGNSPLSIPESLSFLSIFSPSLVIVDVRFPSFLDNRRTVSLRKESDILCFKDSLTIIEKKKNKKELRDIKKFLFRLGLIPLKSVDTPLGSTAHYAGGAPFEDEMSCFSCERDGRLKTNDRLYIADATTWRALPAKPPALTIMANANRVGNEVLKSFLESKNKKRA